MAFLAVRNWHKFQHYKDRGPVWIKLYTELLDDPRFLSLPDAAKGQLCALFLLAAKRNNRLPDKPAALRVLVGATGKLYLSELLEGQWLESIDEQPASRSASNGASATASLSRARAQSREGEGEVETEKETTPPPACARAREVFLAAMPARQRLGWTATLNGWPAGLGTPNGKPFTVEQIDAGLLEYMASNPAPDFSAQHVVRFVEKCANRKPMGNGRSRDTGSFLDLE